VPKYVIQREISNAGRLTPLEHFAEFRGLLQKLGPQLQWLESFVTDDKICCV